MYTAAEQYCFDREFFTRFENGEIAFDKRALAAFEAGRESMRTEWCDEKSRSAFLQTGHYFFTEAVRAAEAERARSEKLLDAAKYVLANGMTSMSTDQKLQGQTVLKLAIDTYEAGRD